LRTDILSTFGVGIISSLLFYLGIHLFKDTLFGCFVLTIPFYAISTAVCFHLKRKDYFDDLINHSLMGLLVLVGATIVSTFLLLAMALFAPVLTLIIYAVFLRYRYRLHPERVSIVATTIALLNIALLSIFGSIQLPLELIITIFIGLSGLFPFLISRNTVKK